MSAIPKRKGQRLNGVMPSVFALAFLLILVPIMSTYLISGAMFFGGEPVVEGYGKSDVLLGDYPYYESSGDGIDAKCDSGSLSYSSVNCTSSLSNYGSYQSLMMHTGKWYQTLSGCANGSGSTYQLSFDCGDSDYRISQNITAKLNIDKIFPIIQFNITSPYIQDCDWARMGDSKVDYTVTLSHMKRDPLFAGTSIWTYGYIDDTLSMSSTESFNNSWIVNFDPSINLCQVKINIEITHELDFIQLDQLSQMLDDYRMSMNESFGMFITIELDNLRTDSGRLWSNVGYFNPFHGNNDSQVRMTLDFVQYDVDPLNTFLRFGVFFMGIGFWAIALASTPYWDPFIQKVKKE
jgi:hypothetical protein